MDTATRRQLLDLVQREVVPAVGCTEPVAVALAAAHAAALLRHKHRTVPARVHCTLSPNIIKNAMGVGIPGTGMTGLPIAVALGALYGDSNDSLEVLAHITPAQVARARSLMVDTGAVTVAQAPAGCDILHIDVAVADSDGHTGHAVITGSHSHITAQGTDGHIHPLCDNRAGTPTPTPGTTRFNDFAQVWQLAMDTPIEELAFIDLSRRLNDHASQTAMDGGYGHAVGHTLMHGSLSGLMGDSVFSRVLARTAAACDARMGGAPVPVMSNSGSGNQGIAATMPVAVYAHECNATRGQTLRALMLSHATVIYIKQSLGRLSALCGCVVAATGSAAALSYLMGGNLNTAQAAVKNMVATLTGMICDGAKPSCALKLTSGVSTAIVSAMMAVDNHQVQPDEGIVDQDIDRTLHNLTAIGHDAMTQTDKLILHIMTSK